MSAGNASMFERNVVTSISPALVDNTTASSAYIAVTNAVRVRAIVIVGATDTTVDAKLEQATDGSGTGLKDITGAAVTQFSATDDNKQRAIDLEVAKMDIANSFDWVRLTITVGDGSTGAYVSGAVICESRHAPVTQPAAFDEVVVVAG